MYIDSHHSDDLRFENKFQTSGSQSPQIGRDACRTTAMVQIGSRGHCKTHGGRGAPGGTPSVSHGANAFRRSPSTRPHEEPLHFLDASRQPLKLGHYPTTYCNGTCHWADRRSFLRREIVCISSISGHVVVKHSVAR